MKKLRITVEGKSYEVQVEVLDEGTMPAPAPVPSPAPAAVASAGVSAPVSSPASSGGGAAAPGDVTSPLAGKVVTVHVSVGQEVAQGAELVTLEAMKMNTFVYAPKSGKISKVAISAGDGVEEGQALLTIN